MLGACWNNWRLALVLYRISIVAYIELSSYSTYPFERILVSNENNTVTLC